MVGFSVGTRAFCSLQNLQTGFGAHAAMGIEEAVTEGEAARKKY